MLTTAKLALAGIFFGAMVALLTGGPIPRAPADLLAAAPRSTASSRTAPSIDGAPRAAPADSTP